MSSLSWKQVGTVTVLLAGAFLAVFNQSLLSSALPAIMRDLSVDATTVQWLTSGYSLIEAVLIPMAAYTLGRFSSRKLFTGALAIFTIGSLLGFCAPNFWVLLLGRMLQACCTGAMLPLITSVILLTFSRGKRGTAMGLIGLVVGVAPAIGPVASGLLVDSVGWRALFLIVGALAVAIILCGLVLLVNYEGFPRTSFDKASFVLSASGMVCFLYGLSNCASSDNVIIPVILMAIGAVLLALFVRRQLNLDKPMLDMRILRAKDYRVSVVAGALFQAGFLGIQLILPLYIQGVRGYSATMSGLALMPGALFGALASMAGGKVYDKVGILRTAIPGGIVVLLGALGLVFYDMDTGYVFIMVVYLILSIGLQFAMTPINTWGLNSLDNSVVQHTQSLTNTINQIAISFGTALLVSLSALGSSMAPSTLDELEQTCAGYHMSFCGAAILFALFFLTIALYARERPARAQESRPSELAFAGAVKTDVYSVPEDATALDALVCMVEHETSGLPVVSSDGSVAGFVSDGDIMRVLSDEADNRSTLLYVYMIWEKGDSFSHRLDQLRETSVMDVATKKVITLSSESRIDEACKVLSNTKIKKVPVLSGEKLVGVLSRSDLMRYIVKQMAGNISELE
ncbi:MAG: MDR family MFS transporter [Eggerthellaceae bacterium]|nr:MDR family MFS transporter [Eggerthellaceae bacterium]